MTESRTLSASLRHRSAAAAYLIAVALFLAGALGLAFDLKTRFDRVEQASARLEQMSRRSPRTPPRTPADAGGQVFLTGRTMTIAAAALEQRIKEAVEKSGGELASSQVEPNNPDAKDGFVKLTANVEIDQAGLQTLLYEIESETPYLFVDKLSVQSPEDFGEPETGRFRVTLAVLGQWRPSE